MKEKPALYNREIVIRSMMGLSLTFHQQRVDGAPTSEFPSTVARYLQDPGLIVS